MVEEKHQSLLANFFIVYSILQGVFVSCWSIFVGVFAVFLALFSGMAHGKTQQNEAFNTVASIFFGIAILVIFAIFSTKTIYRTGNNLLIGINTPENPVSKAKVLSAIGILLNLAAFAITVWYLYSPKVE
jgi:hypothetical protein